MSLTHSKWNDHGTTHVGSGFAFGNTNLELAAKTYKEDIWVSGIYDYVFHFEGFENLDAPVIKLNLNDSNSLSLFEQSQGFDQALVHTEKLHVLAGPSFSVCSVTSDEEVIDNLGPDEDSNIIEQLFVQKDDTIASGRYIIGTRAQNLDSLTGKTWDNHESGIMFDSTTFYTATVLSELDIYKGKTLELGVSGAQNWGAHLTGEGGVAYVGDSGNKTGNVVTIKQLFESNQESDKKKDRLDLANDYKGATTVTNVTLNLERETSLGSSGILTADNADIVEVNQGALGELTEINFKNTMLKTAGTPLVVLGDATFAGANVLDVTESFEVEDEADIKSGSLTTGTAAFKAGSLKLGGAELTASSVEVTKGTTVSGTNTVNASAFSTNNLLLNEKGALTAMGSVTATSADLKGGSISAETLSIDALALSGANTISTENGATVTGDVNLANGVSLDVNRGKFAAGANVTVASGAKLHVADALTVKETLTLVSSDFKKDDPNFVVVGTLKVGEKLAFEGNSFEDGVYAFGTSTSALNSAYDVSLTNANVEYESQLQGVGKTTLNQAHLTLANENASSLGKVVEMTPPSGSGKSRNLLTLTSENGFNEIGGNFSVKGASPEDVIELSGSGVVTFSQSSPFGDENEKYAGWIRMTGTSLDLTQTLDPDLSFSVGTGGTIALSGDQSITLKRLGWAKPTDENGGMLDLSSFDFSNLASDEAAISVDGLTVDGNGVIKLDQSAVSGLSTSGGSDGESIFDAANKADGKIKVIATKSPTAQSGRIDVVLDGVSGSASALEGFFNADGTYTTDSEAAAAKGTWNYGTAFEDDGLYVTHTLTEVELLASQWLKLNLNTNETLGVVMTGSGTLEKSGRGELYLSNRDNTLSGEVRVAEGTLHADAGALGSKGKKDGPASLQVATNGTFLLTGEGTQYLKTLTSDGTIELRNSDPDGSLTLAVFGKDSESAIGENSHLYGTESAELAVTEGATLRIKDLANVASDYDGTIDVGGESYLELVGVRSDNAPADLSLVTGAGTVVLQDRATYTTKEGFTGTMQVAEGGDLTITKDANTADAVLGMTAGKIASEGEHTFKEINFTGGTIHLGNYEAGDEKTSGMLHATGNIKLHDVTLEVSPDYSETQIDATNILTLDNTAGKTTLLLEGASVDSQNVTVNGITDEGHESDLYQNGTKIGTIDYLLTAQIDETSVGVKAVANQINLTGTLELSVAEGMQGEDSTLDLIVNGKEPRSTVSVTGGSVTLKQANSYGKLVVAEGAGVVLGNDQTLAAGGEVNGQVQTGDHNLVVTGGTLEVGKSANGDIGILLDAGENGTAELLFANRTDNSDIFGATVKAGNGAKVTFDNSRGKFALASGTAEYELRNGSAVSFKGVAANFAADTLAVDSGSSAYYLFDGQASSVDLSNVSGEGRVMLSYGQKGGMFDLTAVNGDFTGAIGVRNGTVTIGTDTQAADAEATAFLTREENAGSLLIGSGATLVVANDKTGAGSGNFNPKPVMLGKGASITISPEAVLDFTNGITDSNDGFYGNTSGLSANAIDMNGGNFIVADSTNDGHVSVKADIDALDLSSGFNDAETVKKGSILDLIGDNPSHPVLTLITNIGGDEANLANIASEMELELEDPDVVAEYWQPDWSGEGSDAVHVANVHTGVGLVADTANKGIAIGVGIKQIDVLDGQTLRIDPSVSVDSGKDHILSAKITGENASVSVTNELAGASMDRVIFAVDNSYTGETSFGADAKATAKAAGAFATSSIVRLNEGAELELDTARVQGDPDANAVVMQKLVADGTLVFSNGTDLLLTGANESTVTDKATLEGNAESVLRLEKGAKLAVTEFEDRTVDFEGSFRLAEGTTLALEGEGKVDGHVAIDLSKVKGSGTIELKDFAYHDTTGDFTGTTKVAEGGYLVIGGEDRFVTSHANLAMTNGTIESQNEHVFDSIDLTGGVLNVGEVQAGADIASGALHGKSVNLENVTIKVSSDMKDVTVDASDILTIDNVEGKDTWLVKGDKVEAANVTIEGLEEAEAKDSLLMQGDEQIGTIRHALELVTTDKGVGFKTRADSMNLTGTLNLEGSLDQTADTTLDLTVTGSDTGVIHIAKETVTIDKENSYGALQVDQNASVILNNTQTLAQGGLISGTVSGKGALAVTGGTLTVDATGSGDFAVELDSKGTLAFANRVGDPDVFKGVVNGQEGAVVSFANTTGNFQLASGTAGYVLADKSSVTFGPYKPAENGSFTADTVSVDASSNAYFDVQGEAGATDLSKISGEGRVVLGYAATPEAVGTLDVTAIGSDFTGTLAFTNAQATIGTDESADSVLNDFATKQGSLWVGAGSVLHINNEKVRGENGTVTPNPVKLAGDLTISDVATLDFMTGLRPGAGEDYLGNVSGISVNSLDLNNHKLVIADNGVDDRVMLRVDLEDIDLSTGFQPEGDVKGSILDLMAGTETSPVLTLIQGIDATEDELKALASDMRLVSDDTQDVQVEFWQPSWDPDVEQKEVHVANVHTGVKLVADTEHKGIAVGAGITQIDILSGATLRIDASASESGASVVDASITSKDDDVKVLVTNSLGNAPAEGVKFLAENTYTGETVIDLGAKATAGHASAFAQSKLVSVGTMGEDVNGNRLEVESTLVLDTAQVEGSPYVNAVKIKALELGGNGNLVMKADNDLLLTGSGTSTFAAESHVTGDASTTIGLEKGKLEIADLGTLSDFKGAFRVNSDASVVFTVADAETYTWANDVLNYTDARSRATGAGEFVKTGTGTLVIDGEKNLSLSAMNLVAAEGTTKFTGDASILGLTTNPGAVVEVDGIFETKNLTADKESVFKLDAVTGKTVALKEGETATKSPIWGLGENGSDGILVTGAASGTLNLAVTPKDVGAEESIQLVDANRAADGFTVNLVDEKGAKLEGLTVGAYDYTLVRKDDAQNGTDIFLSSIPGEDEKRNTTVTAGSYIGVAAAAQLFDISLHDRMSNRSWLTANADGSIANSFWVLETVSNERYGDSTGQIDVHDTASTTTVGSDILSGLAAGGTWYAGAMFSYATQDTKSRSNRTALESRADTDAWAAGLYAGWQLNGADRTGPYVDGWILWTDAESDVKGVNVSETVDGNGLSASIEAGWGFKALSYNAHGQAGDIYVEPHVSVTWFGYEADDVSNDVHDVTFEGKDNIRTKLGVKTYAFGKNSGGFSPYVELNWIHNTETYGVTMSNVTVEQVGAEDQGEVRAGADWRINDAFTVWGHFGITSGSDGYSNREASLGVRYNF